MNYYIVLSVLLLLCGDTFSAQLCLEGSFDAQVQQVIEAQLMTKEEFKESFGIVDDLKRTIRKKWKDVEIYPLGSLVTGLAFKSSDVDCYIRVPSENNTTYVLTETKHLIHREPALYQDIVCDCEPHKRLPVLSFLHVPTHRLVDTSYTSPTAIDNSQMLSYYFHLDDRILILAVLLKSWSKLHLLVSVRNVKIPSYSLSLLLIFYLQQKQMVPPFAMLQKPVDNSVEWDGWDTHFDRIPYTSNNTETIYQLLMGFFDYYSTFDFENNVVAPYTGRMVSRSVFRNVSTIPVEFARYKKYLVTPDSKPLNLDTTICIQDVIVLSSNTIAKVNHKKSLYFIAQLKLVARMFKDLPSELVLSNLLINRTVKEYTQTDKIISQCINLE